MFYKRNFNIFSTLLLMSLSIYSQNHEVTPYLLFLKKLSYVMWHAFFFIPKIFGAFFMGNGFYIAQALLLLTCVIIIETYLLHRYIKAPYRLAIPAMTFINFADILIQAAVAYPLFYLIDLHNYPQTVYTKIYCLYGLTIFASIIILLCRITTAYRIYRWFDTKIDKNVLKKAMIKINCMSYVFIVTIFFLLQSTSYRLA